MYYLFPVEGRRQGGADHGGETVQHATLAAVAAEERPHLCRQGVQAAHALRVHDLAVLEGLEPGKNKSFCWNMYRYMSKESHDRLCVPVL